MPTGANTALGFPAKISNVPLLNGQTNSAPFNVPEGVNCMQINPPTTIDGAAATYKLQCVARDGSTWRELDSVSQVAATGAAAQTQLTGFPANRVAVFSYNMFGVGPLRIVSSAAATADRNFEVSFDKS